jgi:hypothetical protein
MLSRALLLLSALASPSLGDEAASMAPLFSDLTQKFVPVGPVEVTSGILPEWLEFDRLVNGFGQVS